MLSHPVHPLTNDPALDELLSRRDKLLAQQRRYTGIAALCLAVFLILTITSIFTAGIGSLLSHPGPSLMPMRSIWWLTGFVLLMLVLSVVAAIAAALRLRFVTKRAEDLADEDSFRAEMPRLQTGQIIGNFRVEAAHETLLHFVNRDSILKVRATKLALLLFAVIMLGSFAFGVVTTGLFLNFGSTSAGSIKIQIIYWLLPFIGAGCLVLALMPTPMQTIVSQEHAAIIVDCNSKIFFRESVVLPAKEMGLALHRNHIAAHAEGKTRIILHFQDVTDPSKKLQACKQHAEALRQQRVVDEMLRVLNLPAHAESNA